MKKDDERTIVGRKLVELRRINKIKSSAIVARDLGIGESTYRRYESEGDARKLGENLGIIAEYFGVTVDYILGREEDTSDENTKSVDTEEIPAVYSPEGEYVIFEKELGKISEREMLFIQDLRDLDDNGKDQVADFIEFLKRKKAD